MVLSGDLKANGHVVLGLNVDAKTIFHGAQTHRGGLAVDHGHLHVEARVDDAVKLAQTFDDHGMLLFNDIAGVGKQQQQNDNRDQKTGKGGDDTGKQHGFSSIGHTLALGYPSWTAPKARWQGQWAKKTKYEYCHYFSSSLFSKIAPCRTRDPSKLSRFVSKPNQINVQLLRNYHKIDL